MKFGDILKMHGKPYMVIHWYDYDRILVCPAHFIDLEWHIFRMGQWNIDR